MRRTCWSFCISALVLCTASIAALAGRVNIVVDTVATSMPVTATISDTDINQVLTTLFNSTKGKYNVQVGVGVTGTVSNLTIANKPFDEALKTILTTVNANFTYTKAADTLYKVTSGQQSGVAVNSPAQPVKTDTATTNPDIKVIKAKLKPMPANTGLGGTGSFAGSGGLSPDGSGTAVAGTEVAAEECLLAMLTVRNIPVNSLCNALGVGSIPAFEEDDDDNNSNNDDDNGGYYDSNGNWVSDDDDNNNDDDDNNNNNNNRNGYYDSNGKWHSN